MSGPRIYINMHLSGTIALADLASIAHLITPESHETLQAVPSAPSTLASTPVAADVAPTEAAPVSTNPAPAETPVSDPNEVDAHGWPWSADMHAGSKGKTKDGLWRMKVGVTRPAPKEGFPKTTETPSSTSTPSQATPAASGATEPAGSSPTEAPASAAVSQEDDEFAAFRAAAAQAEAADAVAAASVPTRTYTDADLGALCNQAAVKLGDPTPIKEIIAQFVPTGEVAHSRNVPADKRADFVKAVEAKAGIEFAG